MDAITRDPTRHTPRSLGLAAAVAACLLAGGAAQAQSQTGVRDLERAAEQQRQEKDQATTSQTGKSQTQSQRQTQGQNQGQGNTDDRFTVKPESIAFGKRPLFTSHTESFWVRGKDQQPVRISNVEVSGGNEKVFTVSNQCQGTLKMQEDCRIDVKFEPTSEGEKTAEIRITSSDNSVRTRQVTGSGVAAKYKVSTETVRFGQVGIKEGGKQQKVTITNTGTIGLPVTSTSLSGPNEKQFEQSNDCPEELAPGRSCASTVIFRPTTAGQHQATLTVWAKGGAPETKVQLSGTATESK